MNARICLLSVVCLLGCGGGNADDPDLGQVTGVVTVGGNPLANAVVTFTPQGDGRPSFAETDDRGYYKLLFKADNPGAMVGKHIVRVELIAPDDQDSQTDEDNAPSALPPAASDGSITQDVTPGGNEIDIAL